MGELLGGSRGFTNLCRSQDMGAKISEKIVSGRFFDDGAEGYVRVVFRKWVV